jgi:hypothetical protein
MSHDTTSYRRHPTDVIAAIAAGLRERGLTRLYLSGCPLIGVLSVAPGLTVWCDGRTLTWRHAGTQTRWPITDTAGAAQELAGLAQRPGQ